VGMVAFVFVGFMYVRVYLVRKAVAENGGGD
jgi:hypothetical protein